MGVHEAIVEHDAEVHGLAVVRVVPGEVLTQKKKQSGPNPFQVRRAVK